MTDETGAASAAAEPVQFQDDNRSYEPAGEHTQETARASLDRAFAAVGEQDDDSAAAKPARRMEAADGRQAVANTEPPPRFSSDAKAAWRAVPDAVKGEVGRALRELEGGLAQYQQAFEPLKGYFQMAQQSGTTIHEALERYTALDGALISAEPEVRLRAIESILDYAGITPRDYAGYILNQRPDDTQSQSDQTIRHLRHELADLRNQLGGVSKSIQQRHEDEAVRLVDEFAVANPRLNEPEFQMTILRLLQTQMADTLQDAYDMAERLNPAPAPSAQFAARGAGSLKAGPAQTRNGNLTITGGPGSGSNPARRRAPSTARESVDSAFASLGLG